MFHACDLSSFIHPYSLRFTIPALETKFIQRKNERIHELTESKIFIAVLCVIQTVIAVYYAIENHQAGDMKNCWGMVIGIIVGNFAFITEYVIHCFDDLRSLRGFPITFAGYFLSFYLSSIYMDFPSVDLAYFFLPLYLLSVFP